MIEFERNKQLNRFSTIFLTKKKLIIQLMKSKPILIVAGELTVYF